MIDRFEFVKNRYPEEAQRTALVYMREYFAKHFKWGEALDPDWDSKDRYVYHWTTAWLDDDWMTDPSDTIKLQGFLLGDYGKFAGNKNGMLSILKLLYTLSKERGEELREEEKTLLKGTVGEMVPSARQLLKNIHLLPIYKNGGHFIAKRLSYLLRFIDNQTAAKFLAMQKPGTTWAEECLMSYLKGPRQENTIIDKISGECDGKRKKGLPDISSLFVK